MKFNPLNRGDYDIMCGMRGPDNGNNYHKTIFTCVIRYLAGQRNVILSGYAHIAYNPPTVNIHGNYANSISEALSYMKRNARPATGPNLHFMAHASSAFVSLYLRLLKSKRKGDAALAKELKTYVGTLVNMGFDISRID
jgi:hypothetical protein